MPNKSLAELSDAELQALIDSMQGGIHTPVPPPPVTGMMGFTEGVMRTGERLGSGLQQGYRYATGNLNTGDIRQREAQAEAAYAPVREAQPGFSFAGEAAPYMLLGGTGPVSGPLTGALGGLLTYTDDPKQRALQAGMGAAGGGFGALMARVPNVQSKAATMADKAGLRVTPGQRSGLSALRRAEAVLESFPPTSGPFSRVRSANQKRINQAALNAIGEQGDSVTGEALNRARSRLNSEFEEIFSTHNVQLGDDMLDALDRAKKIEVEGIVKPEKDLDYTIDKMLEKVTKGELTGPEYNKYRRQLERTMHKNFTSADGDREYAVALGEILDSLDDAAAKSLPESEMARLSTAREQWKYLRILRNPRSVRIEEGRLMPVSAASVAGKADEMGYRLETNQSDFYNTLRAANANRDIVGDSGTGTRLGLLNVLGSSPDLGTFTGRTLAYGLGGPVLSNAYMYSPEIIRMLINNMPRSASVPAAGLLEREYGD